MRASPPDQDKNYTTVSQAIAFIRANARQQPKLAEIADSVNLSEYHLQRIFSEWAGISPKRFLQYLTKEYAKKALQQSCDVLSTSMQSGLSSPGRLHDLMITCEAMTPGEISQQGEGVTVSYGITATPFGPALIGWTERGICHLAFCENNTENLTAELAMAWPGARLVVDNAAASRLSARIFPAEPTAGRLHLVLRGTNFQLKVWEALLNVGSSRLASYSTLARMAGSPGAQRSVGSALAANRIGYLIPCHRVIRESGDAGVYRWGSHRKIAMQAWEGARLEKHRPENTSQADDPGACLPPQPDTEAY